MEIIRMKMNDAKKENGLFVRVLYDEALMLIESLAAQMVRNSPNSERQEFYAGDGTYFTVAVHRSLSSMKEE